MEARASPRVSQAELEYATQKKKQERLCLTDKVEGKNQPPKVVLQGSHMHCGTCMPFPSKLKILSWSELVHQTVL